eukprot:9471314-Pyramimonas_sp.AAC.3
MAFTGSPPFYNLAEEGGEDQAGPIFDTVLTHDGDEVERRHHNVSKRLVFICFHYVPKRLRLAGTPCIMTCQAFPSTDRDRH